MCHLFGIRSLVFHLTTGTVYAPLRKRNSKYKVLVLSLLGCNNPLLWILWNGRCGLQGGGEAPQMILEV
jgi:hypothetical protein